MAKWLYPGDTSNEDDVDWAKFFSADPIEREQYRKNLYGEGSYMPTGNEDDFSDFMQHYGYRWIFPEETNLNGLKANPDSNKYLVDATNQKALASKYIQNQYNSGAWRAGLNPVVTNTEKELLNPALFNLSAPKVSYENQLPYQEYGDPMATAVNDVRKKNLDKVANRLSPGAGFFVGLPAAAIGAGIGAASLGSGIAALNAAYPTLFPDLIASTIGGEAVNAASQFMGYNSWGDMLKKQWNLPGPEWAWNLTNLGYLAGKPIEAGLRGAYNLIDTQITHNPIVGDVASEVAAASEPEHFVSELDWSPESWFKDAAGRHYNDGSLSQYTDFDVERLQRHIPEYMEIERIAKNNGTWLRMPDGTYWPGDPREWVQYMSQAVQKHNPEVFWTGIKNSQIDPNYSGQLWGVYGQGKFSAAKARTYAEDDAHTLPMFSSKNVATSEYDANQSAWHNINGKTTDDIVEKDLSNGIQTVKIKNVSDTGPENVTKRSSRYSFDDDLINYDLINTATTSQNDIILAPNSFRKSLRGNNGDFADSSHMYRGFLPPIFFGAIGLDLFFKLNIFNAKREDADK